MIVKKIKLFYIISLFFVMDKIFAEKFLPYYSFNFSEGVYIPSVGRWGWTTVLSNDIGLIVKPADGYTILCYYQLKYEGPGLKRQEGEKFEYRMMGHTLVLQYNNKLLSNLLLKTKLNYGYDFLRSGTNELWGYGLYDNNVLGGSVEIQYKMLTDLKLGFQLGYNLIKFPNYTSLVEEYFSGAEEVTAGKQDNNMFIISLNTLYKIHNFKFTVIKQNYINQKIISENGTYSNENQQDLSLDLSYNPKDIVLTSNIFFQPYLGLRIKDSNQSFLYLQSYDITTSTPVVCVDYYDYTKLSLSLPFTFYLTTTKFLTLLPEMEFKYYTSRDVRDSQNNFITGEKQKNFLYLLSLMYTSQSVDKHRKVSLFYTYQQQISNMKFEKYYPYNYTGHYFGIKFSYSY